MVNDNKPVAAHFSGTFFVKSETFIYHYLSHMKTITPICLAWNIANLDYFSFPSRDIYLLQLKRYRLKWFYYGILKRLSNRNLYFEGILKSRGVRLIHAHFGHNGVQALQMKGKLNIPLVTTFYGADLSKRDMIDPLKKQYQQLFERGDLFLVEGKHMKSKLSQLGCPEEKIHVQRIAVPVETIRFRERKPKGNQAVKLLFCGRFTEKKGLIYALEAVKKVREDHGHRDIHFCMIGDGELKETVETFVKENRMTDYVELPGFLNYNDYLRRVEEADIFVHPSVTASDGDSEGGAPTTILEAQAMGLPVIATYHADIPNVVVPDKSALLSPERDVDGLCRNILFLLENQHLWTQMGKTGREFIEQYHDIKKEVQNLEEKYNRLIEAR
ncbi:MAG: glycosyltransferase [Candidatus Aminicenantes bacterium]|nr:MAG: glycosyltransferase [Candidatus Aminicenantes bacterium]